MAYITDTRAAEIPALANLDDTGREQALANAERVRRYIQQNPWITDADLRAYGERNGIDPDQMTVAIAVLTDSGRAIHIPDGDR